MRGLAILSALLLAGIAAAAAPGPLPVPGDAKVEVIGEDMLYNGSPMQIVRFSARDEKPVAAFYSRWFGENGVEGKVSDQQFEGRRLIAGLVGKAVVTAELLPEREGLTVLVSSLEPDKLQAPAKLARVWPRLPGTEVLQVVGSRDAGRENTITSMRNPQSVEANASYLRQELLRANWSRVGDDTQRTAVQRQLRFARSGRDLVVDLQRQGEQTLILLNETRR